MLIIKNISRALTIAIVFIGFLSGSLVPATQPTSCCGMDHNQCCCVSDEDIANNDQTSGMSKRCGCQIEESAPPIESDLTAQLSTKANNQFEISYPQFQTSELMFSYKYINSIKVESVRNSGPPIYLASCSLLI